MSLFFVIESPSTPVSDSLSTLIFTSFDVSTVNTFVSFDTLPAKSVYSITIGRLLVASIFIGDTISQLPLGDTFMSFGVDNSTPLTLILIWISELSHCPVRTTLVLSVMKSDDDEPVSDFNEVPP